MGRIRVAFIWNREGTEKLVNGKQHSVWFVPTGMKNLVLYFRLEFPKSDLTTFHPEVLCQMVSTPGVENDIRNEFCSTDALSSTLVSSSDN